MWWYFDIVVLIKNLSRSCTTNSKVQCVWCSGICCWSQWTHSLHFLLTSQKRINYGGWETCDKHSKSKSPIWAQFVCFGILQKHGGSTWTLRYKRLLLKGNKKTMLLNYRWIYINENIVLHIICHFWQTLNRNLTRCTFNIISDFCCHVIMMYV